MPQEYIEIRGARENNLKNVSLRLPKRKITIFTGVSGSGKSSIVFDTIASEAQRLLYENLSLFVRNFLPHYAQPEADSIENLSMAVVVDQKRLGGGSHSTVGTLTDINTLLRLLFSRVGQPHLGPANVFGFNDPQGMCPECSGLDRKIGVDLEAFLDTSKSLNQGAILYPEYAKDSWDYNLFTQGGLFDLDKKLKDYSKTDLEKLLYSPPYKIATTIAGKKINLTVEGIISKFTRKYITQDLKARPERTQKAVAPYLTLGPCTLCRGARLSQPTLNCKINGRSIADFAALEIGQLIGVVRAIKGSVAAPLVADLAQRLQHLVDIGLEYLSLDRPTRSRAANRSASRSSSTSAAA